MTKFCCVFLGIILLAVDLSIDNVFSAIKQTTKKQKRCQGSETHLTCNADEEIKYLTEHRKKEKAQDDLISWITENHVSLRAVDDLLTLLKPVLPGLPKSFKTLLGTPINSNIVSMGDGNYFYDGIKPVLKQFLTLHPQEDESNLKFDLGIDGFRPFRSSKSEFWPLNISFVEYPDIVFTIGCFHGVKKPDADLFISDFVEDYVTFCSEPQQIDGKKISLSLRCIVMDAPAKSFLLKIKGHAGYYSCTRCITKGSYMDNKIVFPNVNDTLRSNESFRTRSQPEHHHQLHEIQLEKLNINIVDQIVIDGMHAIYLGVVKQQVQALMKGKKEHKISVTNRKRINIFLKSYKFPSDFSRYPIKLEDVGSWKATESRMFLLYLCPAIFSANDYLNRDIYINILRLSLATRIMSSKKYQDKLSIARNLLSDFIFNCKKIYGDSFITFNLHNLIHIVDDIEHFGSLEQQSAFKFENSLRKFTRKISPGRSQLAQLHNRLIESYENSKKIQKIATTKSSKIYKARNLKGNLYNFAYFKNCRVSTNFPNCYVSFDENILKVQKIYYFNNDIKVEARAVTNLKSLFYQPINSIELDIFCNHNEHLAKESHIFSLNHIVGKFMKIRNTDINVYISILHTFDE